MSAETIERVGVPDDDGDSYVRVGIGEAALYANATVEPEQLVIQEHQVGEQRAGRRYRQRALGIHAGRLTVRRQNPVLIRHSQVGSEYYLG